MAVTLDSNDHFMNRLLYFSFRVACLRHAVNYPYAFSL